MDYALQEPAERVVLNIPTTRGSNYAVQRTQLLAFYDEGMLADELNVGPTFKAAGGKVGYSGAEQLVVLTSGRMINPGGLLKLLRYFHDRLLYNLRVLRVRPNMARYTYRENDPIRKYVSKQVVE